MCWDGKDSVVGSILFRLNCHGFHCLARSAAIWAFLMTHLYFFYQVANVRMACIIGLSAHRNQWETEKTDYLLKKTIRNSCFKNFVEVRKNKNVPFDAGRTRTCNLRTRSPTPYPLASYISGGIFAHIYQSFNSKKVDLVNFSIR